MKAVQVNEELDIVLARVEGEYHAVYGKCTHYGAPLETGLLNGCRLICPWHHACFDVRDGKHLEAPGLDGLQSYKVVVQGEELLLELPEQVASHVPNQMAARSNTTDTYVVLGGGAAGAYAVEGIRQGGFTGRVIMISREPEVPYDRPNCSKEYLSGDAPEEWMPLRDRDFYQQHGIELMDGMEVTSVDAKNQVIHFSDGDSLNYHKLLVCTGGKPRQLPIQGIDLKNVFPLRSLDDSRKIKAAGEKAKQAVVIGSSFIGLEGAQALHKLDCEVHVVGPEQVPFETLWGKDIGQAIQRVHEQAGIKFHLGQKVSELKGNGKVEKAVLDSGEELEADLVLVGVGVTPATDFIQHHQLEKDGGIKVNEQLAASDSLFAAGDIAHYPYNGGHARIEHWKVAAQQGRIAGLNMAGKQTPYQAVPFFWTAQQDLGLQYIGHLDSYDDIIYDGEPSSGEFVAYFVKNNQIQAALGCMRDLEIMALQELMLEGRVPSPSDVRMGVDWSKVLV